MLEIESSEIFLETISLMRSGLHKVIQTALMIDGKK